MKYLILFIYDLTIFIKVNIKLYLILYKSDQYIFLFI